MAFLRSLLFLPWILTSVLALTLRGADFSSLVNLENQGIRYFDGSSTAQPFETILANHGANLARIRIWTSTRDSEYSLNYGLALARRARSAGMRIMVNLHYSDTWADPAHQSIPSGWPTDLNGLNTRIYTYTNEVVRAFVNQGIPVDFIQIGNEINDGMLWPTGQISRNGYSPLSQLLHSAANGVRDASSSARTIVHLANGWNRVGVTSFFQQIYIPGQLAPEDVDVMAFSFYPFYDTGATYSALRSSMQAILSAHNKDIIIVETDWPVSCSGGSVTEKSIPISAQGQQQWISGITSIVSGLGSHGLGIVYWEPGWIGNAGLGSACGDNLLVDSRGNTRTSIRMFSDNM